MVDGSKVIIEERLDYWWIILPYKIDMENHQQVEQEIKSIIKSKIKVVFDLQRIGYLYSSAIGILIRSRNHIVKQGGAVWLVNVTKKCQENIVSMKLDTLFPIFSSDLIFELSQDSIWEKKLTEKSVPFLCVHTIEKDMCYINLSGRMTSTNDCTSFNFSVYSKDISSYLFDLTALEMIDSHSAFLLLTVIMELKNKGAMPVAFGANDVIRELCTLLGIDEHLKLYKTKKSAILALKRQNK